ncbi:MAG: GTP cyclohydrolase I FolE [Alphaproteobacteria bacterium]|nr:GTP cyclohydrolase I FolE [Clostridia bacterium]MBQ7673331.1 GTP cyclohydrolase I FolE [Alphaproteobacteria bacterium]
MIDKEKIQQLTKEFLLAIGEDPNREGLMDTPRRVADMCDELLNPTRANAKYTSFEANNFGGIVLVKDIDFSSICEHHLVPFIGKVHIAYIPNDRIIGISKFARIVDKHAKKLQLQERLAQDIVADIQNSMEPKGIAIYIEAKHLCMNIRGIARRNASTVTTMFTGVFDDFKMQEMFMDIIKY